MSGKKEDLFGLNNDSDEEDVSLDEEDKEDSRFSKSRLQKQAFGSDDSDDSDSTDDEKEEKDTNKEEDSDEKKSNTKESDVKESNEKAFDEKAPVTNEESKGEDKKEKDKEESYDSEFDSEVELNADGTSKKKKKSRKISAEELEKFQKARKKSGVCYLSRIPPFMQPKRVRQLLNKHAECGRIFLVPEDPKITAKRKKYNKERRTNFTEGWIEFKDRKKAKALAEHLNMREVGGKRQNEFYHEIWNIKYLPKFKWDHLNAHWAQEKQARKQRLRNEIAQANRENKTYIQNVERAKMLQNMEQKKRKREGASAPGPNQFKFKRTFSQRDKVERQIDPNQSGKQIMDNMDNYLKGVLGNIFAKK